VEKRRFSPSSLLLATLLGTSPLCAGTISGVISLAGDLPATALAVDMSAAPDCAAMHDVAIPAGSLSVSGNRGVANAFIYLSEGVDGSEHAPPQEPAVLDQKGCIYSPHVLGMMAGQPLRLLNSDGVMHNVNVQSTTNKGFNRVMPAARTKMTVPGRVFPHVEVMIPLRCDVHPWMSSYLGVLDHPFFAVSSETGSFEISSVPAGSYELTVWHESLAASSRSIQITEPSYRADFKLPARKLEGND
jgi:hypothetical protein